MGKLKSFDPFYETTDWYYGLKPFRELPETLENIKFPANSQGLDLGCGEGRDSIYLAINGFNVTSIDNSMQGLNKLSKFAQEKKLPIKCIFMNALKFNYSPNTYNLIVARTFLDHLTLQQIAQMIKKIKMALQYSGVVLISVFTTKDAGYLKTIPEGESECATFIQHYFDENELKRYFEDWRILTYYERTKIDTSHGPPHQHGVAHLVAQKPNR
jgi:tellurite methyltransferase